MHKIEYGDLVGEAFKPNGEKNVRDFFITSVEFIEDEKFDSKMRKLTGVASPKKFNWGGFISTAGDTKTLYLNDDNHAYRVWEIDAE